VYIYWINTESNAYKLYDPVNRKIVISRDVIFDEKPPHVQTFEWKGEVLQIDKEDPKLKTLSHIGEEEEKRTKKRRKKK
jgi:hypothetical protein